VSRNLVLETGIIPYAIVFDAIALMGLAACGLVLGLVVPALRRMILPLLGVLGIALIGGSLAIKLRGLGHVGGFGSPMGLALLAAVAVLAGAIVVWCRRRGIRPLEALARRPLASGVLLAAVVAAAGVPVLGEERRPRRDPAVPFADAQARGGRPNIVLVVLDTVRADHCSAYGYRKPTTPALERLALEGTLYTNAVSPAIWTVAGHASLFTGVYPGTHRADRVRPILAPEFVTLAEHLKTAGYATGAFSGNPWVSPDNGLARGFDGLTTFMAGRPMRERQRDALSLRHLVRTAFPKPELSSSQMPAADLAQQSLRWIEEQRGEKKPFFLFVNFFDAHWPYTPPENFGARFVPPGTTPEQRERIGNLPESELEFGSTKLTPAELEILRGLYDGDLAAADAGLGMILDRLREDGLTDSTVVAVTADHGEMLGEHGRHGHDLAIFEPLLRVPLVVRWPARFPAGARAAGLVQSHDLYPTLLDLVGLPDIAAERTGAFPGQPPAPDAPCRPLFPEEVASGARPLAFADESHPRTTLARLGVAFPGRDFSAWDRELRAVTDGRFKAVVASDGEQRLYDLLLDPGEENDLSQTQPERLAALAAAIEARRLTEHAGETEGEGRRLEDLPPEMLEQLRSLGYIK